MKPGLGVLLDVLLAAALHELPPHHLVRREQAISVVISVRCGSPSGVTVPRMPTFIAGRKVLDILLGKLVEWRSVDCSSSLRLIVSRINSQALAAPVTKIRSGSKPLALAHALDLRPAQPVVIKRVSANAHSMPRRAYLSRHRLLKAHSSQRSTLPSNRLQPGTRRCPGGYPRGPWRRG